MIIELIGPKGVGKSTVAPLIAQRLGINHYLGQAFHDLDGQQLTTVELWADRAISVARNPGLLLAAWRLRSDTARAGLRFALNTCRRDRFAARAAARDSGVLESGPLNSLIQASASYRRDVTALHSRTFVSDIYVRLMTTADEATSRLMRRGNVTEVRAAEHHDWVARYEAAADGVLSHVDAPVVEVDATPVPGEVAEAASLAVRDLSVARLDGRGT